MLRRSAHIIPVFCALLLLGLLTIVSTQVRGAPRVQDSPDIETVAETVAASTTGITFVGGAKVSATLKAPSITVPTLVRAGDRLVLTASLADVTSAAGPAGWTLVGDKSAASLRSVVWSRIATAGDAGKSVAIVLNAARRAALTVTAYRGVDPAKAVLASASVDANSTSHTTPSVVVPAGSWVMSYWADKGTSTTRWTTPATLTLRAATYTTGLGRVSAAVADSNASRSGTVGGMTATANAVSARAVNWSIVLPATNLPPQAEFTQSCVDLTCDFDASAATDADGTIDDYAWDLGAGGTASGERVSHAFAEPGTYPVQLTVTDNDGDTSQRVSSVSVTAPVSKTLLGFWAGADVVGSGEGARANYDRVSSYLGTPDVYRMFYPGSPGTNFVGSNADFGPPVVVSFKFRPQEVVTGQHDATLRAWFASIPVDRQVWWSYFHEPENDIEAGAFTAAEYRAAWDHILQLAPKRATLAPTLLLMRYTLSIPTKRTVGWYVSDGLKANDEGVLGWDSYLTGTLTTKQVVDDPAAVSASFGLDFAIGETSAKDPARMDQFVKDLIPAVQAKGAKFVTWFETNKAGLDVNEADWRMRPHPDAVSTWTAQ